MTKPNDPHGRYDPQSGALMIELARIMMTAWSEPHLFNHVTGALKGSFGLEDCAIYVLNLETMKLDRASAVGAKRSKPGAILDPLSINLDEGVTGEAALCMTSVRVDDTRTHPEYIADLGGGLSELATPIIWDDKPLGVIDSEHPDIGFFTLEHQKLFETTAGLLADTLARIRRYDVSDPTTTADLSNVVNLATERRRKRIGY